MPSCRRATDSRKLFSGFLGVPVPAKGPPLPRTPLTADGGQCFAARQPKSVAGDTKVLCKTNRAVGPGPDSNPEIFVVEMRANRNDPVRKMLLGGLVAINPCRRLGRERSRHANPKPRVGPLTSTRDRIGALVRTS